MVHIYSCQLELHDNLYYATREIGRLYESEPVIHNYVTPARAIAHTAVLNTWKYANNNYHVEMEKTQKNIPSFCRAKEIAPESVFECFIISHHPLQLPKWIRLGKWMSKAEVKLTELSLSKQKEDLFIYPYPLNPLDVMFTHQVIGYDVINMPPVSLIRNLRMRGEYYQISDRPDLKIPARLSYHFR